MAKHCLDVRVGKESIDRASRIMDALIKALDDRDIELMFDDEDRQTARIVVDGETLGFSLERRRIGNGISRLVRSRRNWRKTPITVTGCQTTRFSRRGISP
jgi:hypothetical protein